MVNNALPRGLRFVSARLPDEQPRLRLSAKHREFGGSHLPLRTTAALRRTRDTRGRPYMRNTLAKFIRNQTGATAIEYGLIAAGIAVAIIVVVQGLGTQLNSTFSSVSSVLK